MFGALFFSMEEDESVILRKMENKLCLNMHEQGLMRERIAKSMLPILTLDVSDKSKAVGWLVDLQPLIFSYSPVAFDEQIAFTLKAYRSMDWEDLQKEKRPSHENPSREAETAEEK